MIKDVMVRLDGSASDELRLAAAVDVAERFDAHLIGLFINALPQIIADEGVTIIGSTDLMTQAREVGDATEEKLNARLSKLPRRTELRRFDAFNGALPAVAAREARSADAYVALRPNGGTEPTRLLEGVLFGSGRHLLLFPDLILKGTSFDHIVVAWNGTRESARALAEAMPYLERAKEVTVIVVTGKEVEDEAVLGEDAVRHLAHHGIDATLVRAPVKANDVGTTLIEEAKRCGADLMVLGGYGHSRVREWLLGGVTHTLLHQSTVPLLLAH